MEAFDPGACGLQGFLFYVTGRDRRMLEDGMSVWTDISSPASPLATAEGALVCVSVDVEPQCLESMLEALALVSFPINPQIYHDAALVYRYTDGREESVARTLVEFPAYECHLPQVRRAIEAYGFDADCLHLTAMLEELQVAGQMEAAPEGAPYLSRRRVKRRT
jgi:hypothetical protein